MSDPLALLPLAAAAGGGSINEIPATRLVAAGLTLLQRCAPLVRALDGRRSAILLPAGPAFLTALAASDGRGAVLINPLAAPAEIAMQLADANVGAVFTVAPLAARLPAGVPRVLLDDAPRAARYAAGGDSREVDLGSHHGLALEGAPGAEGRDEEAAIVYTSAMAGRPLGAILTHRNLLANAWSTVKAVQQSADHHVLALLPFAHLFGLTVTGIAPLLAGARVTTMDRFNPARAAELLAAGGVTEVVGVPAIFAVLLAAVERRRAGVGALRVCICGGAPLAPELQERWFDVTGVELRQGYGLTEAA
ncbi:MAG: AMP-binding protein, partial [Gemmatimonadota bacterium]|nr:AMP-binding protein [Gemmatimonadota bacterium]